MTLGAAQIIWLCLFSAGLTIVLINWGQPTKGRYGIWSIVGAVINVSLLYWGGFFNG